MRYNKINYAPSPKDTGWGDSRENWYLIDNVDTIDSPALVIYKERVIENIRMAKNMVKNDAHLRPHVKTNKIAEVCAMMMQQGIKQFKCATIAEAEMLAIIHAGDVLLAYQPVGPKVQRLLQLVKTYTLTHFSCLIDDYNAAHAIATAFAEQDLVMDVYMDINTGMNRTGIIPDERALELFHQCKQLKGINIIGLHAYDGHVRDTDVDARKQKSDEAFKHVIELAAQIKLLEKKEMKIVAGGSPTFPMHASEENIQCSPGTFVFWDWGYKHTMPDEPFDYAALIVTRIVSVVDNYTVCTDLGHKSVAAENPLPRVHFLNAPDAEPTAQSEEHLVLKVPDTSLYKVGDILYGVPVHICPTVALYEKAFVIEKNKLVDEWKVVARDRTIKI